MIIDGSHIACPKCGWEPDEKSQWQCDVCGTKWNTFETHGKCPGCGKVFVDTQCSRSKGGCGQMSLNADWYVPVEKHKSTKRNGWFWQRADELPINIADRVWLEVNLTELLKVLDPQYVQSVKTITPQDEILQYDFNGNEEEAAIVMKMVAKIMKIDKIDFQLMFFSQAPTDFGDGITATPSETLEGDWIPREPDLVKNQNEEYEMWINLEQLNDLTGLIATFAILFSKYLLVERYKISKTIKTYADLSSIILGFGIFRANAYFKFNQWSDSISFGWHMRKKGGASEQMIAYAMAWLAHYRNEDISWKHFLNKTVRKYFEKSYEYISNENRP